MFGSTLKLFKLENKIKKMKVIIIFVKRYSAAHTDKYKSIINTNPKPPVRGIAIITLISVFPYLAYWRTNTSKY